jgi:uncharacterized protein YheU (UPF0270 family)
VEIPYDQLDPAILDALIEEFVTRSGAIHGHADLALESAIASVRSQLKNGQARILYDEEAQTWTIVPKPR